tara:strand:+ start:1505 stop:1762 length:258 start_codon:yes stop_codon:yes gene_type:complete
MRNQDLIKILTEINDQQRDQTKINSMLIDKLDLFSRTILMVLETQNRMIDIIPEWIDRAEKGNPISDSELKDINEYTKQLLKKVN